MNLRVRMVMGAAVSACMGRSGEENSQSDELSRPARTCASNTQDFNPPSPTRLSTNPLGLTPWHTSGSMEDSVLTMISIPAFLNPVTLVVDWPDEDVCALCSRTEPNRHKHDYIIFDFK